MKEAMTTEQPNFSDEYRMRRTTMRGSLIIGLVMVISLIVIAYQGAGKEAPRCPELEPAPKCECPPPSTPPNPLPAPSGPVTPEAVDKEPAEWEPVQMSTELAGKWVDHKNKPAPSLELFVGREKSKTDFNVRVRGVGQFSVGCGFNEDSEAWCKVFDDEHRKVPNDVKTAVKLEHNSDGVLRVIIEEVGTLYVIRQK